MSILPPIPLEQLDAVQRAVAERIAGGPRGAVRGPFLALMHNPALADRVQALGAHLRFGTGLPQRLVELVILVTARRWNCQYEWAAHLRIARQEGLTEPIIVAVAENIRPATMTEDEALVHDFAIAVHLHGAPGGVVAEATVARFGRAGLLDLLALCGYYSLLAMVLNTAEPPLPDGAAPDVRLG